MRKKVHGRPDTEEYNRKIKELADLFALENSGFLKIFFADESGFSLTPCVPYGWQKIGETQSIPTQRSAQINVFGLLSRDNTFESYYTKGSNTSATIIAYIDDFAKTRTEKTVIVLDNASIHKSEEFLSKREEWKALDIYLFFLPTYSPHLNWIETLWRKMKYEWLKPKDYESLQSLTEALDTILVGIGEDFTIDFKTPKMSIIYD